MEIVIDLVKDSKKKREIVERCDHTFMHGITTRSDYETIFRKIDQNAFFIAAVVNKNYVGYAAIYANDQDEKTAYISMIGVLKDMQRMHIGSKLLEKCIEVSKEQAMEKIRLEVLDENQKGIRFYQKNGFVLEKKCSEKSSYFVKVL